MIKFVCLLMLASICVYIGYRFSNKYKKRAEFFQAMVMLCQKFDVEINYSKERVKNILSGLDVKIKNKLLGIEKNYIAFLEQEQSLEKSVLFQNISILSQSEQDTIFMFFKSLGRSDLESQSKEIRNYQTRFEEMSNVSQNDNKKYGSLSIKLGIIAGLFLIVLLV